MKLAIFLLPIGTLLCVAPLGAQVSGTQVGSAQGIAPVLAPPATPPQVWTVDSNGGADFSTVTAALLTAEDGDTLLLRPGNYAGAVSIDKGVHLIADGAGPVTFNQEVHIHDVNLGSRVTLSGVELSQGFLAQNCGGLVRFQDCFTADPPLHNVWPTGVNWTDISMCNVGDSRHQVVGCRAATFVDCTFYGASGLSGVQGTYEGMPGHHALRVENSNVALYGCRLFGGEGGQGWGSHFAVYAGAGGNGLYLKGTGSTARINDLTATAGLGGGVHPGSSHPSSVTHGCDGQAAFATNPASIVLNTHPDIRLDAPRLLRGGSPRSLVITGQPGTNVYLYSSTGSTWRPGAPSFGILHLIGNPQIQSLGTLPASGQLGWTLFEPAPTSVTEFESLQLQIVGVTAGATYLSAPRQVLVVDPSL